MLFVRRLNFFRFKKAIKFIYNSYRNFRNDNYNQYYLYSIVRELPEDKYEIQCTNLSAVFKATVFDMVRDFKIISGLSPAQACFVGLKYSGLSNNVESVVRWSNKKSSLLYRYGEYQLCYVTRDNSVCFVNNKTFVKEVVDPRTIVCLPGLINNFDSTQAFYLGILAGIKKGGAGHAAAEKHKTHLKVV